jgi:type I restriction enzyme R subunit
VYYEARLAKVELPEEARVALDTGFEDVTELAEVETREKLKTRWARVEAIVGAEKRVAEVAADIVEHWEKRREVLAGKAMIVCMSRRICVALYEAIVKLRPGWHSDNDVAGKSRWSSPARQLTGRSWPSTHAASRHVMT